MSYDLLIITPTLGSSHFFPETMQSIARLRCSYRHIIVCPSWQVERLKAICSESTVVAEPAHTRGLYGAINHGLAAAQSDDWKWFTYINDDDLLLPGVEACLGGAHEDDDLCYGHVDKIDEQSTRIESISTLKSASHFLPLVRSGISGFNQQGAIIRRQICERIGDFDTNLRICADFDYFVRAAVNGARLRYFPVVTGAFRIRAGQISQDIALELEEKTEIYRKNNLDRYLGGAIRAKMLFRFQNSGAYVRRMLRGGFYTSYQLLSGAKKA